MTATQNTVEYIDCVDVALTQSMQSKRFVTSHDCHINLAMTATQNTVLVAVYRDSLKIVVCIFNPPS